MIHNIFIHFSLTASWSEKKVVDNVPSISFRRSGLGQRVQKIPMPMPVSGFWVLTRARCWPKYRTSRRRRRVCTCPELRREPAISAWKLRVFRFDYRRSILYIDYGSFCLFLMSVWIDVSLLLTAGILGWKLPTTSRRDLPPTSLDSAEPYNVHPSILIDLLIDWLCARQCQWPTQFHFALAITHARHTPQRWHCEC